MPLIPSSHLPAVLEPEPAPANARPPSYIDARLNGDAPAASVVASRTPPVQGALHGLLTLAIGSRLHAWASTSRTGVVVVHSGFFLTGDESQICTPDVAFVRQARIPEQGIPAGPWPMPPDLAVEILSPDDSAEAVQALLRHTLASGVALLWAVYPTLREVVSHTPDGLARTFGRDAVLEFPGLLPNLRCPVADFFPTGWKWTG